MEKQEDGKLTESVFLIYNRTIYIGSLIEQNNKMRLRRKGSRSVWICGKNSFNNNICCSQRGNHGLSVITAKTPLVVFEEEKCFLFKLQSNIRVHLFVFLYTERIGSLETMELLTIQQTVLLRDPQNTLSAHNCLSKVYFTFPKGMIRSNNGHSRSINVFLTLHLDNKHNGQIQTKPSWQLLMKDKGHEDFEASKEFELFEMENERKNDQIFQISPAKLLQKRPIKKKHYGMGERVMMLKLSLFPWSLAG